MSREDDQDDKKYEEPMPDELKLMLGDHTPFHMMDISAGGVQPLMTLLDILGMTAEDLGVKEGDTVLSIDQMVQYVKVKQRPIGMINLRGDPQIQFVTPYPGSFDSVLIVVFLPDRMGLLVHHNDTPTVYIDALPDTIRRRWKDAGRVEFEKIAPPGPAPPIQSLPLLAQEQAMEAPKKLPKPGIAPAASAKSAAPIRLKKPGIAPPMKEPPLLSQDPPKKLKKPGVAPSVSAASSSMVQEELKRLREPVAAPVSVSAKSASALQSVAAPSASAAVAQRVTPSAVLSTLPAARPLSTIPESIEPISAPRVLRAASKAPASAIQSAAPSMEAPSALQSAAQSAAPLSVPKPKKPGVAPSAAPSMIAPVSAKSVAPVQSAAPSMIAPASAKSVAPVPSMAIQSAVQSAAPLSAPKLKKPGIASSAKSASAAPAPSAN
jgi:hypothetical protein